MSVDTTTQPFRLWFEFLRESVKYRRQVRARKGGRVYKDFGDIYSCEFDDWWPSHRELFDDKFEDLMQILLIRIDCDPTKQWGVHAIESMEDFEYDIKLGRLIVSVDLSMTKKKLIGDFEGLLKKHYADRKGRPKPDTKIRSIKYPLVGRPNLPALEIMLNVYRTRKENAELKLHEIGEKLRLNPKQMPKRGDSKWHIQEKRRIMTATVSRYFRRAEKLINNAEKGIFPKHD
jgi:hypothetical protein